MRPNLFDKDILNISKNLFAAEEIVVAELVKKAKSFSEVHVEAARKAARYIEKQRQQGLSSSIDSFFALYGMDTKEGRAMMELSEALPRVPDNETTNKLIHDKISDTNWKKAENKTESIFVNASAIGLNVASKLFDLGNVVSGIVDPIVRESFKKAIKMTGEHFVIGSNIDLALKAAKLCEEKNYLVSFDMLGEAARTKDQAKSFLRSYLQAIESLAENCEESELYARPSISVKLSALYPRYELTNYQNVIDEMLPIVKEVISKAMQHNIAVTIDAEECARLDMSLKIFKEIRLDKEYKDFAGIGLAIQSYQKRAYEVVQFIIDLAKKSKCKIPIRLVKGAYWDYEIKQAQVMGLKDFPVFTRKEYTDVSYFACASLILENVDYIYPQFATHNSYTIAAIEEMFVGVDFEFQKLFGMGDEIYEQLVDKQKCRIYAPVGQHKELLPYLIRRLLENSANSSFVRNIVKKDISIDELTTSPIVLSVANEFKSNENIRKTESLYYPIRENSKGHDFGYMSEIDMVVGNISKYNDKSWQAYPLIKGKKIKSSIKRDVPKPYDNKFIIGKVYDIEENGVKDAMDVVSSAFASWSKKSFEQRADIILKYAEILEENKHELISLIMFEAGKTIKDAIGELREAIDFCYFYANQAKSELANSKILLSPDGESNEVLFHPRGVFLCISPWNFPLAIFLGQILAALVTGNTVIAKPAKQTSLIAHRAVELLLDAGLPDNVIAFLPGEGSKIAGGLLGDDRLSGVVFTGSTQAAKAINAKLAERKGAIIPLIAETGGQNVMIVDSSALLERVVDDVLISAFNSSGQRCSALRVLYIQEDIYEPLIAMLQGAIDELIISSPEEINCDIANVIDKEAEIALSTYITGMLGDDNVVASKDISNSLKEKGCFVEPHIFEVNSIQELEGEVFGPILHVAKFKVGELGKVIDDINNYGYGLTIGMHSRADSNIKYLKDNAKIGNIYINRNIIGATVGVQPFGGEGMSGTGPKAGGYEYLKRFMTERTYTVNTAAIGGDFDLLK